MQVSVGENGNPIFVEHFHQCEGCEHALLAGVDEVAHDDETVVVAEHFLDVAQFLAVDLLQLHAFAQVVDVDVELGQLQQFGFEVDQVDLAHRTQKQFAHEDAQHPQAAPHVQNVARLHEVGVLLQFGEHEQQRTHALPAQRETRHVLGADALEQLLRLYCTLLEVDAFDRHRRRALESAFYQEVV
eukprot:CAMPEP_0116959754 /NCGR_PEP_ID=MMETSP0467-20121206/45520_1 /TAXON_ID=283647 /ORGANISM="Mesodinium pulex, Strain SPMC105" /LENGTH=185 /DNA_ID=CAMNT_0004647285 /DNA_START=341 /DNA_END=898 /DNA_ORIENTATION=-